MTLVYVLLWLLIFLAVIYPLGLLIFRLFFNRSDLFPALGLGLIFITLESWLIVPLTGWTLCLCLIYLQSAVIWLIIRKLWRPEIPNLKRVHVVVFIFIIISVFINSQLMVGFGRLSDTGISLPGAHYMDTTWHQALVNELLLYVPPQNPLYAGELLSNYHYLTDLQIALLSKLSFIPVQPVLYDLIVPTYLLITSVLIYQFSRTLFKSRLAGLFSLLFLMLSSNWYFLAKIFYPSAHNWPSLAWIDFFSSKVVNPPLGFSLTILLLIWQLIFWGRRGQMQIIVISVILASTLAFKIHTWAFLVSGLAIYAFLKFLRRDFYTLYILLLSAPLSWVILSSTVSSGISTLKFAPLWFIRVMYESPDRLNFPTWELRRQYLLAHSSLPGQIRLWFTGVTEFLFYNFSPLFCGLILVLHKKSLHRDEYLCLAGTAGTGVLLALTFIYTTSAIVTIQFAYSANVVLAVLFSGLLAQFFVRSRFWTIAAAVVIWGSLLPGLAWTVDQYVSSKGSSSLAPALSAAITELNGLPYGAVIVSPDLVTTSLVPAYSGKPLYVGDEGTLFSRGVNPRTRESLVSQVLACRQILPPSVKYIFASNSFPCLLSDPNLLPIYANNQYAIFTSK